MSLPFAITNPAVSSISPSEVDWVGTVEPQYFGQYFDYGMLLVFGGIPWQVRVLFFNYNENNYHFIFIDQ